jgi:hypothetical protein
MYQRQLRPLESPPVVCNSCFTVNNRIKRTAVRTSEIEAELAMFVRVLQSLYFVR